MKRTHAFLLIVSLAALAGAPASARDWSVELVVQESAGVARKDEPVGGGVPLPMGLVKKPADVHLADANGKEVPAQFSAINRWGHDGSVCWLLVQSRATVPAKGKVSFFLRPGAAKARPLHVVSVGENGDNITVRVPLAVDDRGDGHLERAQEWRFSKKQPPPVGATLVLKNGEIYRAAPPERIVVEEKGPERAVIMMSGRHRPVKPGASLPYCYGYVIRVRWHARRRAMHVSYTLTNDAYPPIGSPVCARGGVLGGRGAPTLIKVAFGDNKTWAAKSRPGTPVRLLCPAAGRARVTGFGVEPRLDARSLGWMAVVGEQGADFIGVRYLGQNHPAALVAGSKGPGGAFGLEFWPGEAGDANYLEPCAHKTYELLMLSTGTDKEGVISGGAKLFAAFNSPLRFWCKPEWVAKTKAWGDFGGLAVPDDKMKTWIRRRFRPFRSTGWRHYGSTPSMESGSSRAPGGGYEPIITDGRFYLGYLQTGDRRYFDQLERTSWHWRDRHFIHLQKDISSLKWPGRGGVYYKYMADGGKAFPKVQLPDYRRRFHGRWNYGGRWGPMDTQHFSVDEVVNYYYLTGDRGCLAAINKYGEEAASFVNAFVRAKGAKISRQHGWCTRALMAVYEATGEKRWLDLARKAVHAIIAAQDKRVGTIYDVRQQQVPFMAAAVGMALGRYYKHYPEEEVRDAILGLADWLAYDVAARDGGFSYRWDWDKPGKRSVSGNRCMSTMGWAYLATGQKRYMDAADAHAGFKQRGERALAYWYLSGFGQEYIMLKKSRRPDEAPPAAVKDLAATALGGGKVRLTWTAPGDDGARGTAAEYQVKYAAKEIKERADWRTRPDAEISFWAATNCKGEPRPARAGTKETFTVTGLEPGAYWFALKTYDEQPNQSDLSNVVKVEVK